MAKARRIGSILITTTAIALASTATSGVAQSAVSAPDRTAKNITERQVSGLLKYNPGAKRISTDSVQLAKGVVVTVQPRTASLVSVSLCSFRHGDSVGWLCMYQNSNWGGYNLDLYKCGNVNLANYHMGDGRPWNDQISSIDNDQTSGVQSRFYNYKGSGDPNSSANWNLVIVLNAGHYLRNLADDSSADGGNANDKIDIVHVC
ncbi:MAG TPA: hypothetical protein VF069_11685 [Streptosporangiaceae bacterium]